MRAFWADLQGWPPLVQLAACLGIGAGVGWLIFLLVVVLVGWWNLATSI